MIVTVMRAKAQTFRVMGQDEKVDARGSGPGSKYGDSLWVSSKVADVLIEPAQSLNLVQQPIIPLSELISSAQKTCKERESQTDGVDGIKRPQSIC